MASALDLSESVILASVAQEEYFPPDESKGERGYVSTIDVHAALKGNPEQQLIVRDLGMSCPHTGQRLHSGEQVLLMLDQNCYPRRLGGPEECDWVIPRGGKILLRPGGAILDDMHYDPVFVGVPDAVVRDIGQRAGASDEQIEAALQAAAIPASEASSTLAIVLATTFSALLVALIAVRLRERRA